MTAEPQHFDVLIVGAGLSGIGAACHLRRRCPDKSFVILEGRDAIGGTWDLFRYPGIRSDSDMYTLGYSFRPWEEQKAIADGPSILAYVRDTAREYDVDGNIRFRHRVARARWSSERACWTVEADVEGSGEPAVFTCGFLFLCGGYYKYAAGYTPEFPGRERYRGRVVHPQHWSDDVEYAGKRVVVIGSGATAVTLVPALAGSAAHVTMLQRSPTYVVARPAVDAMAQKLRRYLPSKAAYAINRWKRILLGMYFYRVCRSDPDRAARMIRGGVRMALGPDYDVDKHFNPRYKPWDQRLCLVPDGDLFDSIRLGRASVVTDTIESFTETGVKLTSGAEIEADLIVTATGLELEVMNGLALSVDGESVEPGRLLTYKGMMYEGVPNLASAFGYTNASWTLKCDLTCEYVCRLLEYMDRHGYRRCVPRNGDPNVAQLPWVDFTSGYFQRAIDRLPKQGAKAPWRLYQSYVHDLAMLRFGRLDDGTMEFSGRFESQAGLGRSASAA